MPKTPTVTTLFEQTEKTFLADLPAERFEGRIVVVQSESEAQRAVAMLCRERAVGIDTETRPSFRKGEDHPVALLQISTLELCFLFRLNLMGLPASLVQLLCSPDTLKIGLSLKDDFHRLHRMADFRQQACVDLQTTAAAMGIRDMSLQKLYANVFRKRISKSAQLSNWEADVLSDKQKAYAATDAYTCLKLYHRLGELRESGDYRILPAARPAAAPPPREAAAKKPAPRRSPHRKRHTT